jgi:TIR domain-containing protein
MTPPAHVDSRSSERAVAKVFISHAHGDKVLAAKVVELLASALALKPADFFCSSQEGRGVAPAAPIREEALRNLTAAPVLIVLLTPKSAESRWVWLEAGGRLASTDRQNPIFVVPSERHKPLLQPVADLRCLQLDNEGELHELVKEVAQRLDTKPAEILDYHAQLKDLADTTRRTYSPFRERSARAGAWLKTNAALVLLTIMLAGGTMAYGAYNEVALNAEGNCVDALNEGVVNAAARYLTLKGRVVSGPRNVPDAIVMASHGTDVKDPAACQEPGCTLTRTTTEGQFTIPLTRIQARDGDDVVLSVVKAGFNFFSQEVRVDVRAMDAKVAPQIVSLDAAAGPGPGGGRPNP